jgi:hypothetical protein
MSPPIGDCSLVTAGQIMLYNKSRMIYLADTNKGDMSAQPPVSYIAQGMHRTLKAVE